MKNEITSKLVSSSDLIQNTHNYLVELVYLYTLRALASSCVKYIKKLKQNILFIKYHKNNSKHSKLTFFFKCYSNLYFYRLLQKHVNLKLNFLFLLSLSFLSSSLSLSLSHLQLFLLSHSIDSPFLSHFFFSDLVLRVVGRKPWGVARGSLAWSVVCDSPSIKTLVGFFFFNFWV